MAEGNRAAPSFLRMSMKIGDTGDQDLIARLEAGARAHRRPQRTPDCPDEQRLRLLLPGQVDAQEAGQLLTHASECDWCGTVLREAARDLTEPPTREEEGLAAKARLANPRRRRELARRIAHPKPADPKPGFLIFRWWPAAGLATAALVGAVAYPQWARSAAHTEHLLAEAYTQQRTVEMRLPGAKWGAERIKMGAGSSSFNEPSELLDARSNIKRAIDAHPDDPHWRQLQGRADLMEGREDAAIAELERARSIRPNDIAILADLGAAYYQKGAKTDDLEQYKDSYQRLSEGLRLKKDDPTLLFDQALAAERIQAPTAARQAWEDYLKVDSTSGFANEARAHLAGVKKNLRNSGSTPPKPPLPN